jgi:hypothetical protein
MTEVVGTGVSKLKENWSQDLTWACQVDSPADHFNMAEILNLMPLASSSSWTSCMFNMSTFLLVFPLW